MFEIRVVNSAVLFYYQFVQAYCFLNLVCVQTSIQICMVFFKTGRHCRLVDGASQHTWAINQPTRSGRGLVDTPMSCMLLLRVRRWLYWLRVGALVVVVVVVLLLFFFFFLRWGQRARVLLLLPVSVLPSNVLSDGQSSVARVSKHNRKYEPASALECAVGSRFVLEAVSRHLRAGRSQSCLVSVHFFPRFCVLPRLLRPEQEHLNGPQCLRWAW